MVSFIGNKLLPIRTINLPVTTGVGDKQIMKVVHYPSAYNSILGRPTLNQIKVVTSTYHLLMCFPTKEGVGEVIGDQVTAQECYVASLKGEPTTKETMPIYSLEVRDERIQTITELRGKMEDVILDVRYLDRVTRIRSNISEEFKK